MRSTPGYVLLWTYDVEADIWRALKQRAAVPGSVVRRLARERLQAEDGGVAIDLIEWAEAIRDVLEDDWRHGLTRECA